MRFTLLVLFVSACGATEVYYSPSAGGGSGSSAGGSGSTGGGSGSTGGGSGSTGGGAAMGGGSATGGGSAGSCSPTTCPSGCCGALNNCLPGNTNGACGTAGRACAACLTGQACDATSRTCGAPFDPSMTFTVIVTTAQVAAMKPGGGAWDDLSDPDCGVELYCPSTAGSVTATAGSQSDTFSPAWTSTSGTCRLTATQLLGAGFAFGAFDSDLISNDTITGKTTVTPAMAELLSGSKTVTNAGGLTSITFRFTSP